MLLVRWVLGTDAMVKSEVGRPQTGLSPQWALLLAGSSKAAHPSSVPFHMLLSLLVCCVFGLVLLLILRR